MKVLNTIISSSNNIYLVKSNEIKNIELKNIENSTETEYFFIPTIRNATADIFTILQVNFQTNISGVEFVFYIQILPFIGSSKTYKLYLNNIEIVGEVVNSPGIYKITVLLDEDNPIIIKID